MTGTGDGEPFIYSVGTGRIKFLGTDYGAPTQMSNRAYTNDDKVISFSGLTQSSGRPYVWTGSPSRDSIYSGVANDLWAYLDAGQAPYGSSFGTSVTGINKDFVIGGGAFPIENSGVPHVVWISSTATQWTRASGTETITLGSLATGSSASGFNDVDGVFTRVNSAAAPGGIGPNIIVEVTANVGSAGEIAFRPTTRLWLSGMTAEYKVDLWNYSTGAWVNFFTAGSMPRYWNTDRVKTTNTTSYTDGSGNVKARMTVRLTSSPPPGTLSWPADFEQGVWMYK